LQSSIPESCKLKFLIIAKKHVKSYLTPTAASAASIFIALAIKSLTLTQTKKSRQNLAISAGAVL